MTDFYKVFGWLLYFVFTAWLHAASAQPSQGAINSTEWALPVHAIPNQPLRILKYSGPSDDVSLEVSALQKVLAPADGTLIYKGSLGRNHEGFLILHADNFVSIIKSPFSWEESTDLLPGSYLQKGQMIAVVRGGRPEIMRNLNWSLHNIQKQKLLTSIDQLIVGQGVEALNTKDGLYDQLTLEPQINTKGLLGMGSYQLDIQAANADACGILVFGQQLTCRAAETHDFMVPVGLYKMTIENGNFFKSQFVISNYISSPDTLIQKIYKDDSGKFVPGSYEVKLSESTKLPDNFITGNAMKLAEAVVSERFGESSSNVNSESTDFVRDTSQAKDLNLIKQVDELRKIRLAEEAQLKEQQRLALDAQRREQVRLAQEAEQKELQRRAVEEQQKEISRQSEIAKAREIEQVRKMKELEAIAEASKAKDLELQKLKEQLAFAQNPTASSHLPAGNLERKIRKALILGNDSYKDVPVLLNARSDAKAVSASLARSGFEISLHLDLTERGMKEAIRTFKSQIKGGDEVVMYFAGHGVQLGATNYLLPVDIRGQSEDQVRDEAIPLQRMLDDMQDTKARFALAIIDACRDNPFKTAGRNIGGRGLGVTSAATGQMVMFSAGTGQQALDRLGPNDKEPNGLFTRVLLKEMDKPGVSIERLVRNVRNEVARLSKSVGHDQVPAVYDQTLGDFYFRPQ
jgi:hypothetical protein